MKRGTRMMKQANLTENLNSSIIRIIINTAG